jgi:hypothetical protein
MFALPKRHQKKSVTQANHIRQCKEVILVIWRENSPAPRARTALSTKSSIIVNAGKDTRAGTPPRLNSVKRAAIRNIECFRSVA